MSEVGLNRHYTDTKVRDVKKKKKRLDLDLYDNLKKST